jgi:hypothetical protein
VIQEAPEQISRSKLLAHLDAPYSPGRTLAVGGFREPER